MNLIKPQRMFEGLKVLTFIILAFLIWKALLNIVIIPAPSYISKQILELTFSSQLSGVVYSQEKNQLEVEMTLFKAKHEYPNNTYAPELVREGRTIISLKSFSSYTLGIPFFWLLCMFVARRKIPILAIGTSMMLLVISFITCLKVLYEVSIIISGNNLFRYQDGDYIKEPYQYPVWLSDVLKPILDLTTESLLYVFPLIITYVLCRKNIITLMKQNSPENSIEVRDEDCGMSK